MILNPQCEELRGGYVVTGNLPSSATFVSVPFPDGYSKDNSVIVSWQIETSSGEWRTGQGIISATFFRTFAMLSSTIQMYNNDPALYGKQFKIMLMKY